MTDGEIKSFQLRSFTLKCTLTIDNRIRQEWTCSKKKTTKESCVIRDEHRNSRGRKENRRARRGGDETLPARVDIRVQSETKRRYTISGDV